ncbi:MAG: T9SS type A sorting domain-containing protein [Sphingobacteriales bacterium]|nr:T9SS type A sorting domain-containing protein [Sphingobacteriales bacterium]
MKTALLFLLSGFFCVHNLHAQNCENFTYQQEQIKRDASFSTKLNAVENFISNHISSGFINRTEGNIIRIPVVVHILYHTSSEKISDELVMSQLEVLNRSFRHRNADSVKTPAAFKPLAADCEIEFQLATSDSRSRYTTGIVRKYTPVTKWAMDDKMKFSAEMGDDAWDAKSYLNIWVCNMDKLAGYSSLPGAEVTKDGVVLDFGAFGVTSNTGYGMGKTAVHEIGHWLGLKHLWGDAYCGDDGVDDTPKQASYTSGCPTTVRITCSNGPNGDMYMNYMDFTRDDCTNMFTKGQKARIKALFEPGGPRYSLLSSKGLNPPLIFEAPLPEADPQWLHPQLYPNPSNSYITLDLTYDSRWIGKVIHITNLQGQTVMQITISSKNLQININKLPAGIYFLAAKKDDGESMKLRFVKL